MVEDAMAVFCERLRYLFFVNPLTGSQAITRTLMEQLHGELMPPEDVVRRGKVLARRQNTTPKMLLMAELLAKSEFDDLLKFTVVRNPFDLLVARFLKQGGVRPGDDAPEEGSGKAAGLSFSTWLNKTHEAMLSEQRESRAQLQYADQVDMVIRFEAQQAGFDEVLKRLGVKEPLRLYPDPEKPGPKTLDYRRFYGDEDVALVARLYAKTLSRFGYSFDSEKTA
ncbi:MAG: hypothetical protein C4K60_12695 [Ideonella sp. MAG2]|nr:MAG: hypothetical protein C4K60_12695 [Ideonella sp. MAG2]